MSLQIQKALKDKRLLKAIIGMSKKEFEQLLKKFAPLVMHKPYKKNRKRKPGAGRKHTLDTAEKKLFFILMYMKTYPTFDLAGFLWGVNRSQAKRWVDELRGKLEKALGKEMVLPERKVHSMVEFVQRFPQVKKIIIDGTERPIRRPKDKNKQKECYSGKKKRHTQKNIVIASPKKEILMLSPTSNGREHDYTLLKKSGLLESIPQDVVCYFDLGFVGVEKDYKVKCCLPYKKPRNGELTTQQKEFNKELSRFRVRVENALAGIKRFRCISDICRNRSEELKDHLMFLACGLWNFHLKVA
jgi:hypothetical protein